MQNKMEYNHTIYLKGLCIYILRKWKFLIGMIIVFAVLLGGYKVVSGPQLITNQELIEENQNVIERLESTQNENQQVISENQSTIESNEEAIEERTKLISDYERQLVALENLLQTQQTSLDALQLDLETSETSSDDRLYALSQVSELTEKIYNNNIEISSIKNKISSYEAEIEKLNQENKTLLSSNGELEKQITDNKTQINSLKEEMEPKEVPISVNDVVKFTVIGAVFGGFLACFWAFLQYCFSKKLRDAMEISERYGYCILADLYRPSSSKCGRISKLLDRWEGVGRKIDVCEMYHLVAAKIQNSTSRVPVQIMVTGTVSKEALTDVCGELRKFLPTTQYSLCVEEDLAYNAQAILRLNESEVVLVEEKGVSDIRKMDDLFLFLRDEHVSIVGVIVR